MKRWGKSLLSLFTLAGGMVVVAVVSSVPYLAAAIIFPLLAVGFLYIEDEPPQITSKVDFPADARVGQKFEVKSEISVRGQSGLYMFSFPVPHHFMREGKSNVHLVFLQKGAREARFTYDLIPMRRGRMQVPDTLAFTFPVYAVMNTSETVIPNRSSVVVQPSLSMISRNTIRTKATRFFPKSANSRVGPISTDFNSLRNYMHGDSFRSINWKASARSPTGSLIVNDYFREGLRNFVFISDRGNTMKLGTREDNPLEHSISFILSYSRLLLRNGFNVGIWKVPAWLSRERTFIMPNSGTDQYNRIRDFLMRTEIRSTPNQKYTLNSGLSRVLGETRPAVYLTTNIERENLDQLNNLVDSCLKLGSTVFLIDIVPYGIIAKYQGGSIDTHGISSLFMGSRKQRYSTISRRCRIITWDPVEQTVGNVLSRAMGMTRGCGSTRRSGFSSSSHPPLSRCCSPHRS